MENIIALEPKGDTLATVICGDAGKRDFSVAPNRLGPFRLLIEEEVDLLGLDKTQEVTAEDGTVSKVKVQYATIEPQRAAKGWRLA